jgi:hypothetical protein
MISLRAQHTGSLDTDRGNWVEGERPFVYADGTLIPPKLLRDVPEQNYLSKHVQAVGLGLMTIALLLVTLSALWVYRNRGHSVVIAAQPALLYTLCFGSAITCLVIFVSSFDESYGWSQESLTRACFASVWMDSFGLMVIFAALFTKVRTS